MHLVGYLYEEAMIDFVTSYNRCIVEGCNFCLVYVADIPY